MSTDTQFHVQGAALRRARRKTYLSKLEHWADRNAQILALRRQGETLVAIGVMFGVSRQRVFQILVRQVELENQRLFPRTTPEAAIASRNARRAEHRARARAAA